MLYESRSKRYWKEAFKTKGRRWKQLELRCQKKGKERKIKKGVILKIYDVVWGKSNVWKRFARHSWNYLWILLRHFFDNVLHTDISSCYPNSLCWVDLNLPSLPVKYCSQVQTTWNPITLTWRVFCWQNDSAHYNLNVFIYCLVMECIWISKPLVGKNVTSFEL